MKKSVLHRICIACLFLLLASGSFGQISVGVSISANIPPPPLPVYSQPPCPTDGYLWSPGYWAFTNGEYFWVPGTWVLPPQPGFLWTPAWWGYDGGVYGFHSGYWGPHVGFYGGVNYGYGYGGAGFGGGRWEGNSFRYNTAVVNVNRTVVHNTYVDKTVIINNHTTNNRTSYNGGPKGIAARPTPQEQSASAERHVQPTAEQTTHMQHASQNRAQFASVNHGKPPAVAVARPLTHNDRAAGPSTVSHAGSTPVSRSQNKAVAPAPRPNAQHAALPQRTRPTTNTDAQQPGLTQHHNAASQRPLPQQQNRAVQPPRASQSPSHPEHGAESHAHPVAPAQHAGAHREHR